MRRLPSALPVAAQRPAGAQALQWRRILHQLQVQRCHLAVSAVLRATQTRSLRASVRTRLNKIPDWQTALGSRAPSDPRKVAPIPTTTTSSSTVKAAAAAQAAPGVPQKKVAPAGKARPRGKAASYEELEQLGMGTFSEEKRNRILDHAFQKSGKNVEFQGDMFKRIRVRKEFLGAGRGDTKLVRLSQLLEDHGITADMIRDARDYVEWH